MTQFYYIVLALAMVGLGSIFIGCTIVWFVWRDDPSHSPIPVPKFFQRFK